MGDLLVAIRTRQIKTESSIWNKPKPPNNPPKFSSPSYFSAAHLFALTEQKDGRRKNKRSRESASLFDFLEEAFNLAMDGEPSTAELAGFTQGQIRIGERKPVEGAGEVVLKVITAIMKLNLDADIAKNFEIAIKTAYGQPKFAREDETGLRPLTEKLEQAE